MQADMFGIWVNQILSWKIWVQYLNASATLSNTYSLRQFVKCLWKLNHLYTWFDMIYQIKIAIFHSYVK